MTLILSHTTANGATHAPVCKSLSRPSPEDVLGGGFTETGSGFTNTGLTPFANLGAGQNEHQQKVTLKTTTVGTFSETIQVSGTGSNASGYSGSLAPQTITITITITGTVTAGAVVQSGAGAQYGTSGMSFLLGSQPAGAATATGLGAADLSAQPSLAEWLPGVRRYPGRGERERLGQYRTAAPISADPVTLASHGLADGLLAVVHVALS